MAKFYDEGFNPDDLIIRVSELLVATADGSDDLIDGVVTEVLALLRERMKMDVVFVSEFVNDERVFRYVENPPGNPLVPVGGSDPLEDTWCQRVVDGRLPEFIPNYADLPAEVKARTPITPFEIGTFLSTPILLDHGMVYGTLCCLSFSPHETVQQRDLRNLKSIAVLLATKLKRNLAGHPTTLPPAPVTRQPK